ncbi:MAG TPA: glutamate--tRNA ligase, partial [Solirubrobacterales bacterium]|nr:glutamate--tRNA ligase [Solirubrobacterales bacterium]
KTMKERAPAALAAAREALAAADGFDPAVVEAALAPLPERLELKPGKVYQPIRVAISGGTVSPGIFESLAVLGREESLRRIDAALVRLNA